MYFICAFKYHNIQHTECKQNEHFHFHANFVFLLISPFKLINGDQRSVCISYSEGFFSFLRDSIAFSMLYYEQYESEANIILCIILS